MSHLAGTMVAVGYHWTNNGVLGEVPADLVPEGSPPSACRRRRRAGKVIIGEVAAEVGAEVIEVEVMPDHVHLLAEVPPTVPRSRLVGLAKGRSSRLLCMECPRLRRLPVLWSPSWVVSTVGGAPLEVVCRYVENQKAGS